MRDSLCKAFCEQISVRRVPCGYAVTVPFTYSDGDPVTFYVIKDDEWHMHLEDDGTQVPILEATGVDISKGTRGELFGEILDEYSLVFDRQRRVLRSSSFAEGLLPYESLRFTAALLRMQDLAFLHPRAIRSTFREDAFAAIRDRFAGRAEVLENAPISHRLGGYTSDVVIAGVERIPLAIYLGTSDEKGLQALVLKMETEKYQNIPCRVVLLVERAKDNPLREVTYALAQARLDEVLSFRGVESDAILRIDQLYEQRLGAVQ